MEQAFDLINVVLNYCVETDNAVVTEKEEVEDGPDKYCCYMYTIYSDADAEGVGASPAAAFVDLAEKLKALGYTAGNGE